ncbi:hypothetical protein [Hazenella coriacea]|uniref:hypothetical protein n=1 Tax=Hazenella coriacea TaxID=1179467 RepID=UPI001045664F|nr:hypothetical protein [Hazenella coriacea]
MGLFVFLFLVAVIIGLVFLFEELTSDPSALFSTEATLEGDETNYEEEGIITNVKMENELEQSELDHIQKKKYLNGSESLIIYYDKWDDQSEICILTNERLIYDTRGNITSIPLSQIETIKKYKVHYDEGLMADVFVIISKDGSRSKVEIVEHEGSAVFERELNDAQKNKNGENTSWIKKTRVCFLINGTD